MKPALTPPNLADLWSVAGRRRNERADCVLNNKENPLKKAFMAIALVLVLVSCSERPLAHPYDDAQAVEIILKAAEDHGWTVAEVATDRLPAGHFSSGRGGHYVEVAGPTPIDLHWYGPSGVTHREEALARESIQFWIMPGSYRQIPQFDPSPPDYTEPIYRSQGLRVYGRTGHRIDDQGRIEAVRRQASSIWPNVPESQVSWQTWEQDIARAFSAARRGAV